MLSYAGKTARGYAEWCRIRLRRSKAGKQPGDGLRLMTTPYTRVPVMLTTDRKPDALRTMARTAGWRDCDLDWERLQERALEALRNGRPALAARLWRRGWLLAVLHFRRDDPRHATSLANLGLAARLAGRERLARRRYAAALKRWAGAPGWIGRMTSARRGRSSLFHLQMEAAHWAAYDQSLRAEALRTARDAADHLDAAARGLPPPGRLCDRWPGEKPAIFDDLRKFLGAALLIAAGTQPPPPQTTIKPARMAATEGEPRT